MAGTKTLKTDTMTPVIPLTGVDAGEASSGNSFVDKTTEAVRTILANQVKDFIAVNEDFTEEENNLLRIRDWKDFGDAASEIVRVVMDEQKQKMFAKSEAESGKTSCWKRVGNEIMACFFRKFARKSFMNSVAQLRKKFDCFQQSEESSSLKQLLDVLDWNMEDMIPQQEGRKKRKATDNVCLYQKTAIDIINDKHKVMAHRLEKATLRHLNPKQERKEHILVEVQIKVNTFMELMLNWLNQQAQEHERKRDPVSAALEQIQELLVDLPALTEGHAPASVTDETAVSDEAEELPRQATSQPGGGWDDLAFTMMATAMVERIMRNTSFRPPHDKIRALTLALKATLSAKIAECGFTVKPKPPHFERIAEEAYKDLCKKMNTPGLVRRYMLLEDEIMNEYMVDSVIKSLPKPKKTTK